MFVNLMWLQMEGLMYAVGKVFKANEFNDDDMVDRLNHHFTVLFLIVAMVVVTTTQYVGSPINCWCPAYFTDSHIDFTNKVSSLLSEHIIRFSNIIQDGPKTGLYLQVCNSLYMMT